MVNEKTKLETIADISSTVNSKRTLLKKDSVLSNYMISLWPKGKLIFSPDGGFSGDFDSVLWRGSLTQINKSKEITADQIEQNGTLRTSLATSQNKIIDRTEVIKATFPSYKLIAIGAILAIFILIYWFKR